MPESGEIQKELARLDSIQEALGDAAARGDLEAVEIIRKVMAHRAEVLGI